MSTTSSLGPEDATPTAGPNSWRSSCARSVGPASRRLISTRSPWKWPTRTSWTSGRLASLCSKSARASASPNGPACSRISPSYRRGSSCNQGLRRGRGGARARPGDRHRQRHGDGGRVGERPRAVAHRSPPPAGHEPGGRGQQEREHQQRRARRPHVCRDDLDHLGRAPLRRPRDPGAFAVEPAAARRALAARRPCPCRHRASFPETPSRIAAAALLTLGAPSSVRRQGSCRAVVE